MYLSFIIDDHSDLLPVINSKQYKNGALLTTLHRVFINKWVIHYYSEPCYYSRLSSDETKAQSSNISKDEHPGASEHSRRSDSKAASQWGGVQTPSSWAEHSISVCGLEATPTYYPPPTPAPGVVGLNK